MTSTQLPLTRVARSPRTFFFILSGVILAAFPAAQAANTEFDVVNGSTDLTSLGSYTTGGTPGTGVGGTAAASTPTDASDATFDSGVAYSPAAFTVGSNQTFGSLNDLSSPALTLSNAGGTAAATLTLGGVGSTGNSVPGATASDLIYVASGANLTISGGGGVTALNLNLAQTGTINTVGNATISSVISGAGLGFTKTGGGSLTLFGANTYSGGTTIDNGTLSANNPVALGTGSVTLGTLNSANSVTLAAAGTTVSNPLFINSGGSRVIKPANSATGNFTGLMTLVSGSSRAVAKLVTFGGPLNVTGGTTGTGDIVIDSDNSVRSSVITLGNAATTINHSGTVTNQNIGSGAVIIAGAIGANVTGINENSRASLTLSKSTGSTYTGPTSVTNTTTFAGSTSALLVTNTSGSATGGGAVTVSGSAANKTATLGGTGIIAPTGSNSVTIGNNDILAPGNTAATGTTFNQGTTTLKIDGSGSTATNVLSLTSGSKIVFNLNTSLASSKLSVLGGIDFTGNPTIDFSDRTNAGAGGGLTTGLYTLITDAAANPYTGLTFGGLAADGNQIITGGLTLGTGLGAYGTTQFELDSNNTIFLNILPVPEPGVLTMLFPGLLVLGCWRQRFQQKLA